MLVRLYDLDPAPPAIPPRVVLRPAMAYETSLVRDWIAEHFTLGWADEFFATTAALPATNLLAVEDGQILGFACYDATAKGFFGPTGVHPNHRGRGLGQALLLHTLHRMRHAGYAYAIIGGVGPADFYTRVANAVPIPGSTPGAYPPKLNPQPPADHPPLG